MRNKYLLFLICLPVFFSCENYRSSIPEMPVYLERNLNTIDCLFPGDYWRITSREKAADRIGYGGVILVRAFDESYYAFDLSCPVEASATVRVGAPDETLRVKCPQCGEIYDLSFGLGVPTKGVSEEGLLRYTVVASANGNIIVKK